ncbi:hypothetical protein [Glycomyces terrestris]|uniref:Uncharacterized protein n=1 Tax=Glycomyces terrestris TaxID=2493553 RepID=A0A426UXW5_9ACTN|nr:hypothetical protein [Glycomyces terrestris]RRR99409.1 hypothetical protein EIW28_11895 [Glycomyces terrestris]
MSTLEFAAALAAAMFVLVAAFQVALAAGAPWGRAAYGGRNVHLPTGFRVASGIAAGAMVLLALTVLRRARMISWSPLPDAALPVAGWVVVAFLALSVAANLISTSAVERAIWAPVAAVALAATVAVNLLAPE